MQNKTLPIRKIVTYLNNVESEGGGFWLPNIQRPFVWSEEQIARLFDSIMREYPISTLLIWKTKEVIKHRKFIDNYHRDLKLTDFYVPENRHSKLLVLDGQQRLQTLFIGLRGSYCGKELYFDVLSGGDAAAPEDIRFRFAFKEKVTAAWPWVRFKDIVFVNNRLDLQIALDLQKLAPLRLTPEQIQRLQINVARARQEFVNAENITFQELDGIDNPDAYNVDDIVEIFIRANSGGTRLGKSDLLFSLLAASWEDADGEMENLLEDLNQGRFAFDRDFVLKASLCVLGKGASYEIRKFRDGKTKEEIIEKWEQISAAIKAVRDFVVSKTYIRSDKAMPSYQALIPLIYFRYRFPSQFNSTGGLQEYLLRSLINGVFSGSPDNLIDKIVRNIEELKAFVLDEVFAVIRADGRSLEITRDVIFGQHYQSREIHLFFNLWYKDFDYIPALDENGPQVDHIFPQSLLKSVRDVNEASGRRNLLRYRQEQRDQIANCMLLTAEENGFSGKCNAPPEQWFSPSRFTSKNAQEAYLNLHLIPKDPELWRLENFDNFVAARKELIAAKFSRILPGDLSAAQTADVDRVQKGDEQSETGAHGTEVELKTQTTVIANKNSKVLPEIVLKVGAEGGTLTILRERIVEQGWQFRIELNETTLYDMLSEEDQRGMRVEDFARTEYAPTCQEALRRIDRYQWFRLYPLEVHPEYLDAVLAEVRKNGGLDEVARWRERLEVSAIRLKT